MESQSTSILVFTASASSAFRAVMRGIGHGARQRGWTVRTINLSRTPTPIVDMVREWCPRAAITYYLDPDVIPAALPAVHVNPAHHSAKTWTVRHDSSETGLIAARELISAGLDHFAFIGTATPTDWSQQRGKAFESAIATLFPASHCGHGALALRISHRGQGALALRPTVRHQDPVADQRALKRYLATLPRPCGIFAANDRIAELVIAAARSARLAIPDDLAVIGADNDEQLCENCPTSLSSIAPDFIRGGELACELLEARFNGSGRKSLVYGDLGVIRRASTRRPQKPNATVSNLLEYIRLNATSGISAADVAKQAKCSRRAIELAFRAATGHSIGQELTAVRLDLAMRHLADPTIMIGEIPALVGYVSQNQLERVFRRQFGVTMREWRSVKQVRKKISPTP